MSANDPDIVNQALMDEWGEPVTLYPGATDERSVIGIVALPADAQSTDPGNVLKVFLMLSTLGRRPTLDDKVRLESTNYIVEKVVAIRDGGLEIIIRGGTNSNL